MNDRVVLTSHVQGLSHGVSYIGSVFVVKGVKQSVKYKYIGVPIIVAILAATVASCGGTNPTTTPSNNAQVPVITTSPTSSATTTTPPATTPAPDAMLKLVNTASAAMSTFESTSHVVMDMSLMGFTMNADMTATMIVDVSGKKFFMGLVSQSSAAGQAVSMTEQMYLINDTLYLLTNSPDSGLSPTTWYKETLAGVDLTDMWKTQDVGSQIQTLLDSAVLQIIGTETVNGVQCFKLKITPNMDKFLSYLSASGNDLSTLGIDAAAQTFKQLNVSIWVNKANYLPVKMDIGMAFDAQGMTINMTTSSTFDKVNQPVTVTLPSVAQAALPMPG